MAQTVFLSDTKITVTGDLGSGKSAVSRLLCEKTGFQYISTGAIQRKMAAEMGIDTLALNRLADIDPSIDRQIDAIFLELGADKNAYVIDSRMAWFFLPQSFKVYLQANVEVAARRILSDPNRNSEQYANITEAVEKINARKASENNRFRLKYGADAGNLNHFDLVIDTSVRQPEQVAELVLKALYINLKGIPFPRYHT